MTNNIPDISFITICYNGFKDTCELIESLQNKIHSVSYEIIVVDNASHENEAAKIHQLYPTVVAIRSNENSGFSGGNNILMGSNDSKMEPFAVTDVIYNEVEDGVNMKIVLNIVLRINTYNNSQVYTLPIVSRLN